MYGFPTHAVWTAAKFKAPFLTVVFNNGGYFTMDQILDSIYGPENFSAKMTKRVATSFSPSPDYTMIARAGGAWAEKVAEPDRIRPAIREGLARVREGQPALLEMVLATT